MALNRSNCSNLEQLALKGLTMLSPGVEGVNSTNNNKSQSRSFSVHKNHTQKKIAENTNSTHVSNDNEQLIASATREIHSILWKPRLHNVKWSRPCSLHNNDSHHNWICVVTSTENVQLIQRMDQTQVDNIFTEIHRLQTILNILLHNHVIYIPNRLAILTL